MPDLPVAPCFQWTPKDCFFYFLEEVETTMRPNLFGLIHASQCEEFVYDSQGGVWISRCEGQKDSYSLWSKILAQVYYPRHQAAVTWTRVRGYELGELKAAYIEAINKDDDILLQHVDEEMLLPRVQACGSFEELVEVWRWASVDHWEEDE